MNLSLRQQPALILTQEQFPRCPYCNWPLKRIPEESVKCPNCGGIIDPGDFCEVTADQRGTE